MPGIRARRFSKALITLLTILAVVVAGMLIGYIDIYSVDTPWEFGFYLSACIGLGFAFPRLCWLWPAIFAYTLYFVHLWAIQHGFHQPFVEKNELHALFCLLNGIPLLIAGILAGALRFVVSDTRRVTAR